MLILFHVIIALSSVAYTTYLFFSPSKGHFYAAYALIGSTLASGTYLVIASHSPLLPSCVTGLVYISVVLTGVVAAHRKYVSVKIEK